MALSELPDHACDIYVIHPPLGLPGDRAEGLTQPLTPLSHCVSGNKSKPAAENISCQSRWVAGEAIGAGLINVSQ